MVFAEDAEIQSETKYAISAVNGAVFGSSNFLKQEDGSVETLTKRSLVQ